MPPLFTYKPPHSLLLFTLLAFSSLTHVFADNIISVTRPASTVTISSNSPSFVFELNYTNAFDVSLDNTTSDPALASFCKATFEEISSNLQSQGPLNFKGDHIFDNVVTNENYSFILDSKSLSVLAVDDSNPGSPILIKSNFPNAGQDSELDETFLEIASDSRALYIVTKKLLLSYSLSEFYEALANGKPVPPIENSAKDFPGFSAVETVRYYEDNLYVVADKVVHVWFCAKGDVTKQIVFDENFLKTAPIALSIVDITFQGRYAFLLDSLNGVYAVDVKNARIQNFRSLGLTINMKKGQLIKAVKNSLNIVSSSSKTVLLTEYSITDEATELILKPNRQSEVYQSVISMEADDTFLYIITGLFNIVIKHSVPSSYDTLSIEQSLFDFWQLYRIDAVTAIKRRYGSGLAVVRDDSLSVYTFTKNPLLKCDMEGVSEGRYNAYLRVRENTCDEKMKSSDSEGFNTICETRQDINLYVANEGSDLGDITWSYKATIGLVAGIILLLILILVFCCLFRKYKRQYESLQSKIKFKKLQQQEKGGKGQQQLKGSDGGFREAANQQDWRQKNSEVPNFQNWEDDKKKGSVQDLGDLKQLDYDDIYADVKGHK